MSEYKRLTDSKTAKAMKENGNTTNPYYIYLAELEDKLEAGKLVELPCEVGDTVYSVGLVFSDGYEFDKKGHETPVHSSGWRIMKTEVTAKNIYRICDGCVNKRAFLTREAAEARLKELEVIEK